jgi:hypothetical protein
MSDRLLDDSIYNRNEAEAARAEATELRAALAAAQARAQACERERDAVVEAYMTTSDVKLSNEAYNKFMHALVTQTHRGDTYRARALALRSKLRKLGPTNGVHWWLNWRKAEAHVIYLTAERDRLAAPLREAQTYVTDYIDRFRDDSEAIALENKISDVFLAALAGSEK